MDSETPFGINDRSEEGSIPIARILGSPPRLVGGILDPGRPTSGENVGVDAELGIGTDDGDDPTDGAGALHSDEVGWNPLANDVTRAPIETPGDASDAAGGRNGDPSWPVACCCISCWAVAAA